MGGTWAAALLIGGLPLTGCEEQDACDRYCPAAGDAFERSLLENDLSWGEEVGYTDRADWDAWCATIQMEDRLLADTAADPTAAHAERIAACEGGL